MFAQDNSRRWRRWTMAAVLTVVAIAAIPVGCVAVTYTRAPVSTIGGVDFTHRLAIPTLDTGTVDAEGVRVFGLEMRSGRTQFRPGTWTETWGFNGDHLGPTLRARRGERVRVEVDNRLGETSSVHWHGMHLPAVMDGGPHQAIAAGGRWTPTWTVDQPAATLWYHPHPHGTTESHVRRGLAGMFFLDDDTSDALSLPHAYGVDDVPVVVQDVSLRGNRLDGTHRMFRDVGFLGEQILVNGTLAPFHEVGDELVRLRLLNASTARRYDFGFSDDRDFALIGTDSGLLSRPASLSRLALSPGERAEIVVRMRPGERTVLRSTPRTDGLDFWNRRFSGGDDGFDILELRAADALRPSPELPAVLAPTTTPDGAAAVRERHFTLELSGINGRAMDMGRIDFAVTRRTEEIWEVRNTDGMPHNFHVHDVRFAVLSVDGAPPPPALSGPKDTVYVAPGRTVRLALRFDGPADPTTPYMYHCHLLWHEDTAMMGQFVVVEPGQDAATHIPHGH
ncbi:multicopper oxidase family protein [Nocardia bovistercoris]|uniref:Multicopper oxidase domain-containing protein n=1 Tax=Nocardia bovistercoris TaxID=2785916 RepID=A0A931IF75_9NOCA|nr:multicopper oxidase domain-containing protein [Nocardia bovistercoris]MBH0780329.1 multicopper oxidase domain-containing protein [Nocardia bovistercoris]